MCLVSVGVCCLPPLWAWVWCEVPTIPKYQSPEFQAHSGSLLTENQESSIWSEQGELHSSVMQSLKCSTHNWEVWHSIPEQRKRMGSLLSSASHLQVCRCDTLLCNAIVSMFISWENCSSIPGQNWDTWAVSLHLCLLHSAVDGDWDSVSGCVPSSGVMGLHCQRQTTQRWKLKAFRPGVWRCSQSWSQESKS